VRAYEQKYLEERGFEVRAKTSKYSINTNVLGVTTSGSEIDHFASPGPETYTISAPPSAWPTSPMRARLRFEKGVLTHLDGHALSGEDAFQPFEGLLALVEHDSTAKGETGVDTRSTNGLPDYGARVVENHARPAARLEHTSNFAKCISE